METLAIATAYAAYETAHNIQPRNPDFSDFKLSINSRWLSYLGILFLSSQVVLNHGAIAQTIALSNPITNAIVNTNSSCLNVRESPSTNSRIVACLSKGTPLANIVGEQNGWYQLATGNWVAKQYVATSPAQIRNISNSATSTCLNIRSSPQGGVVDCILDGKVLPDVVREENGLYQLEGGNWVAKEYVEWQQPTVSLNRNSRPSNSRVTTPVRSMAVMRYVRGNPLAGPEVTRLQTKLNYYELLPNPIAVDGVFGRETELAVLSFQGKRGLQQDGIVGVATKAALEL